MTRVKRGSIARKYRKGILDFASGFRGAHSRLFRAALSNAVVWRLIYSSADSSLLTDSYFCNQSKGLTDKEPFPRRKEASYAKGD